MSEINTILHKIALNRTIININHISAMAYLDNAFAHGFVFNKISAEFGLVITESLIHNRENSISKTVDKVCKRKIFTIETAGISGKLQQICKRKVPVNNTKLNMTVYLGALFISFEYSGFGFQNKSIVFAVKSNNVNVVKTIFFRNIWARFSFFRLDFRRSAGELYQQWSIRQQH